MIDAEQCRQLLNYDSTTGIFTWRVKTGQRGQVGAVAGSKHKDGYLQIQIGGRKYLSHRLAWLHVKGEWPVYLLDHRDGNRKNNIFTNLRHADRSINSQNQRRARADNKTGLLGATRNGKGWKAVINLKGVRYYLGTFSSPEKAHEVYLAAKRKLHPANML